MTKTNDQYQGNAVSSKYLISDPNQHNISKKSLLQTTNTKVMPLSSKYLLSDPNQYFRTKKSLLQTTNTKVMPYLPSA